MSGRYKILLVEDDRVDRMAMERQMEMESFPFECYFTGSVAETLENLETRRFDAAVLDYNLEDGTAFDIVRHLKDTPWLIVTGMGDEEIAVEALKSGASDYLIKDQDLSYLKMLNIAIEGAIRTAASERKVKRLSHAVDQSPSMLVITDVDGNIEFVNPRFTELTGYTMDEVAGRNSRILKSGENLPELYEDLWRTISRGEVWKGEFLNKKKNGELFWESASITALRNSDNEITNYFKVAEDITERKKVEMEKEALIGELKAALENIKILEGLMPICASCKKIRDNDGYWHQVEVYIREHTEAEFTHSICPECANQLYPRYGSER